MTADNRTNETTPEQVEAAAKAMWDLRKLSGDPEWDVLEYGVKNEYRKDARAALAAADAVEPSGNPGQLPPVIRVAEALDPASWPHLSKWDRETRMEEAARVLQLIRREAADNAD